MARPRIIGAFKHRLEVYNGPVYRGGAEFKTRCKLREKDARTKLLSMMSYRERDGDTITLSYNTKVEIP